MITNENNILTIKKNNIQFIIISIILFILGIISIYFFSINKIDYNKFESYIGIILIIISFRIILFDWEKIELIFNKNENYFLLTNKTLLNRKEKKVILTQIKSIYYSEAFDYSSYKGLPNSIILNITKIDLNLAYNETLTILKNKKILLPSKNNYKIKISEQISNFLNIPFEKTLLKK